MINANELRIGNFVFDENKEYRKIIGLLAGQIIVLINNSPVGKKEELYSPIPLTPEILEKCGFGYEESRSGNFSLTKYGDSFGGEITFEENTFAIYSGLGDPGSYGFKLECKFVHQLQNVIFVLTGEELEISFSEKTVS